jgi:hypothetical protein
MADYTRGEVTQTRVEFVLPSPTNWHEISKVLSSLDQELPNDRKQWADTVLVEARDEAIVFCYVKERGNG